MTIYDISEKAGVSIATVSRVLNGSNNVSEKTKKKVLDVTPALLNGYADIVDQIAAYRKITLESSIGSANKDTLNIIKLLVYGFVAVLVILMLIRRMKERAKSKN